MTSYLNTPIPPQIQLPQLPTVQNIEPCFYHKYSSAIVNVIISGYLWIRITGSGGAPSGLYTIPFKNVINGFFIREHYIVTALTGLGFASLNNIPFFTTNPLNPQRAYVVMSDRDIDSTDPITDLNNQLSNAINFCKIRIRVDRVNGTDCSYTYKPRIVGIDAARNIAVLRIDDLDPENRGYPPVSCEHPYLKWGNSQKLCIGDLLYLIRVIPNTTTKYMDRTRVNIPFFIDPNFPKVEAVLTLLTGFGGLGTPLMNRKGHIMAVYTIPYSVLSVSAHMAEYIVDALITGIHGPLGCHMTTTNLTNVGYNINIFIQPILGFQYNVLEGNSLEVQTPVEPPGFPFNLTPTLTYGNVCTIEWCCKNYCMGNSRKHYQPIQIARKAVLNDILPTCVAGGVTVDLPYTIPDQILLLLSPFYSYTFLQDLLYLNLSNLSNNTVTALQYLFIALAKYLIYMNRFI